MMSFFAQSYKSPAQIRQEGFHLPDHGGGANSSGANGTAPGGNANSNHASTNSFDFSVPHTVAFLPDAFRRGNGMDFGDELASLLAAGSGEQNQPHHPHQHPQQQQQHHHPPLHDRSPAASSATSAAPLQNGPPPGPYDEYGRPAPHTRAPPASAPGGLFDISHTHQSNGPQPSADYAPHFPATLRFDALDPNTTASAPPSSLPQQQAYPTPSSSLRQTPSPRAQDSSRSRSRSSGPARSANSTRARRNNSISGISPPSSSLSRPGIVIPHRNSMNGHGGHVSMHSFGSAGTSGTPTAPWFIAGQQGQEYPFPDSHPLHHLPHHHHHHHHAQSFSSFGMSVSPPDSVIAPGSSVQDADVVSEKRRRRRESHNAVERRRRDNINEKISELATLIPECMLDASGVSNGSGNNNGGVATAGAVATPNATNMTNAASVSAAAAMGGATSPVSPLEADPMLANLQLGLGAGFGGMIPAQSPVIKEEKDEIGGATPGMTPVGPGSHDGGTVKANKGMILRKSVEYIRYLQQLVTAQASRNRELESQLNEYRDGVSRRDKLGVDGSTGQGMDMMLPQVLPQHTHAHHTLHAHQSHDMGYTWGETLASMREEDDMDASRGASEESAVMGVAGPGVSDEERGRRGRDGRPRRLGGVGDEGDGMREGGDMEE